MDKKTFRFYIDITAKDIFEAREHLNDMGIIDTLDMVLNCDD